MGGILSERARKWYTQGMAKAGKKRPGRGGLRVSLYPLTPDQATAALLKVKLSDVKKLEAQEAKSKRNAKP